MAIFRSPVYNRGTILRPENQTESAETSMTIAVPVGSALAINDLLYFGTLGENIAVQQVHLVADPFDSNAAATLAGALGAVPSTTAKTSGAVTGVTGYNSVFTATTLAQNNSVGKNISRFAGGGTGDAFNINPYPVRTTKSDIVLVISAAAATAITNTLRNITVRVKYQYKDYNERYPNGVDNSAYPLSGAITYGDIPGYNYGGQTAFGS